MTDFWTDFFGFLAKPVSSRYEVGDFVSTDQFICKTPGQLPKGYGHESKERHFQGGTIYNDAALDLIWVENLVSLGANEMVMDKACFEQ